MSEKWLIIGVSGITCGGKTTVSKELNKLIPQSVVISQDDYFLDVNDPRHTWIPELNHINFDILSSLDMKKMHQDLLSLIKFQDDECNLNNKGDSKYETIELMTIDDILRKIRTKIEEKRLNILIVEGFSIFNYKPIADLCYLKYYFTLNQDECRRRRSKRIYDPPDGPGYFDVCVWPEYLNLLDYVKSHVQHIKYFDGMQKPPIRELLMDVFNLIVDI